MEHSRLHMGRVNPVVGDTFVTNHRRPILTLTEDTSGGVHDTLLAACDRYRYELLGASGEHDNCTDNLHAALDFTLPCTPSPLNLFENARPAPDGTIEIAAPISDAGQSRHFARGTRRHRACSRPARRTWRRPTAPAPPTPSTASSPCDIHD